MKRTIIAGAILALATSAVWADPGNNGGGNGGCGVGQQTNGCGTIGGVGGAGGNGYGGVGIGVGGNVAGSGNSHNANTNLNANSNTIRNSNRNTNRQQQGQIQGQQQAAIASQGQSSRNDNRSAASAYNAGNNAAQSVNVAGDTYERPAPPVFAGNIPAVPTSCRLYLFGGGTNVNGAVSGSIPLGNDQTCLSIAALNLMERAGGFTQHEKQVIVCKVEGMAELDTCRALTRAAAQMAVIQLVQIAERYTITAAGAQRTH